MGKFGVNKTQSSTAYVRGVCMAYADMHMMYGIRWWLENEWLAIGGRKRYERGCGERQEVMHLLRHTNTVAPGTHPTNTVAPGTHPTNTVAPGIHPSPLRPRGR